MNGQPPDEDDLGRRDQQIRQQLWDNVQRNPEDYRANLEMALYCATHRRYIQFAEPYLLKVLSFDRTDASTELAMLHLGRLYIAKGQFGPAEQVLDLLTRMNPEHTDAYFERGYAALLAGEFPKAQQHYETVNAIPATHADRIAAERKEPTTRTLGPINVLLDNFGELGTNIDFLVKAWHAGWLPKFRAVLPVTQAQVCNQTLLDYASEFVTVVRDQEEAEKWLRDWPGCEFHMQSMPGPDGRWNWCIAPYRQIQAWWAQQDLPPVFRLTDDHRQRGGEFLRRLGVPKDAWFVTLHSREMKAYDVGRAYNPVAFRNGRIEDYLPAIEAITARGGWVIRIGDPEMAPLPKTERVIDYATEMAREDWFDIFLLGACRLFVGVASGPLDVAMAFGSPIVATNWFPPPNWPVARDLIFVPKLLRRRQEGRLLSIRESCAPPFGYNAYATVYDDNDLDVVDNNPEDIRAAVVEMMDRLDGKEQDDADAETLRSAFADCADPYGLKCPWHPANGFLRRHRDLLGRESGA